MWRGIVRNDHIIDAEEPGTRHMWVIRYWTFITLNIEHRTPIIRLSGSSTAYNRFFFCIFAQESRIETVRLKISFSEPLSLSTQKYPWRKNWNFSPEFAFNKPGSTLHSVKIFNELEFITSDKSSASAGLSISKRWSYNLTSALTAFSAETQCNVPFTFLPNKYVSFNVTAYQFNTFGHRCFI